MLIYGKYRKKGALHWRDYARRESYKKWVDWIVDFFPAGKSVLDIGCGDGLLTWLLAKKGLKATGFDVSEYGIKLSRERQEEIGKLPSPPKFWIAEAELIARHNIENFKFDYALAVETIEHMWDYKAVRQIFDKYVKRYMILTTPNKERHRKDKHHVREFTEEELRAEFDGYRIERFKEAKGVRISKKMIVLKISKKILEVPHPESYLRIQRKEDYATFAEKDRYKNARKGESVFFRKFMKKIGKKVAETTKIFSQHIETENKGYPKGFKNYDTFKHDYRPRKRKES